LFAPSVFIAQAAGVAHGTPEADNDARLEPASVVAAWADVKATACSKRRSASAAMASNNAWLPDALAPAPGSSNELCPCNNARHCTPHVRDSDASTLASGSGNPDAIANAEQALADKKATTKCNAMSKATRGRELDLWLAQLRHTTMRGVGGHHDVERAQRCA
jgi:hypothetical protein